MIIELEGNEIKTENDFHCQFAVLIGVGSSYGCNTDALWDLLSASIERPVMLYWRNSQNSKAMMGSTFDCIVKILERVKLQDESLGWEDRFSYKLL